MRGVITVSVPTAAEASGRCGVSRDGLLLSPSYKHVPMLERKYVLVHVEVYPCAAWGRRVELPRGAPPQVVPPFQVWAMSSGGHQPRHAPAALNIERKIWYLGN